MTNLTFIDQCSSTNDEVLKYFPENPFSIFGIYTFNQTNGRGQYGNSWNILPGENIALSILVKTQPYMSDILINFYTAIILRDFVANLTDCETKIKWPNDVILNGKKVSGILIEKKKLDSQQFYIIGIGVNILQKNFENIPKAGSIASQTGKTFDPTLFAQEFFLVFSDAIVKPITEDWIISEVNKHLFKRNEVCVFNIQDIRQNGIIQHVDKDGFLWVELEHDGLQKFFHKEIEMLY